MVDWLVAVHSLWRWVVLLTAVFAVVLALLSATGRRPWNAVSDRTALFFTISMDVQLLIGLALWLLQARWGDGLYLGYIHPVVMIAAVGLAHMGKMRADKEDTDRAKGSRASIFFLGSLLVTLVAIPFYSWHL